jgi:Ca2+-binding RTX toxin-like protein
LAAAALAGLSTSAVGAESSFNNFGALAVPDNSTVTSSIVVTGHAPLTDLNVTLNGVSAENPDDLDVMLEGPTGVTVLLVSDAGGNDDVGNISLSFDDAAVSEVPNAGPIPSGTYKPTNYGGGDSLVANATTLSAFNGTDPNGTWTLHVADDHNNGATSLGAGWTLRLQPPPTCNGLAPTIVGSDGPESIVGTPANDVIVALGGDDVVDGLSGKDVLCGGDGDDSLRGRGGKDRLFGEAGKDRLIGGPKADRCSGGPGRDVAKGCERGRA